MRQTLGVLLALLCVGCGVRRPDLAIVELDPRLETYVNSFVQESIVFNSPVVVNSLKVNIEEIQNGTTIALCKSSAGVATITFDATWLAYFESNKMGDDIEQVMFHELGHCVLGRKHNDTIKGNIPVSIMNTYHFSGSLYKLYRNEYLKELFSFR